jgi:hypothetical protein
VTTSEARSESVDLEEGRADSPLPRSFRPSPLRRPPSPTSAHCDTLPDPSCAVAPYTPRVLPAHPYAFTRVPVRRGPERAVPCALYALCASAASHRPNPFPSLSSPKPPRLTRHLPWRLPWHAALFFVFFKKRIF